MNAALKATKGEETRAQILDAAVYMASEGGFEALTIGSLAERTGLSKSGLFAHFGSKLELQIAVLDESARRFTEAVFMPALKAPRGLKRLTALFEGWVDWTGRASLPGGCPIDAATQEYDHMAGPMHDAVVERQKILERELSKTVRLAMETGEFSADVDPLQFAFEMLGLILASYRCKMLFGTDIARKRAMTGFARLVESARAPSASQTAALGR